MSDIDAVRDRNIATVWEYFRLQNESDLDGWLELWAVDCRHVIPFAPHNFPRALEGRDELERVYRRLYAGYRSLEVDATIYPMLDPNTVVAQWYTRAELVGGGAYSGEVMGMFTFGDDGKLREVTEYFNPIAFLKAIRKA
jgi:ketosteroid isomerase-like protein